MSCRNYEYKLDELRRCGCRRGAKRYRESKNKNLRAIKELAAALKKLGHKEA